MSSEEKNYKVKKIKKYNELISEERKKHVAYCVLIGASAIAMLTLKDIGDLVSNSLGYEVSAGFYMGSLMMMGGSISSLKALIESVSKCSVLKFNVDELEEELEKIENVETRGRKK